MAKAAHRVLTGLVLAAATLTTAAAILFWAAGPAHSVEVNLRLEAPRLRDIDVPIALDAPNELTRGRIRTALGALPRVAGIESRPFITTRWRTWRFGLPPWEAIIDPHQGTWRKLEPDGDVDAFLDVLMNDLQDVREIYVEP